MSRNNRPSARRTQLRDAKIFNPVSETISLVAELAKKLDLAGGTVTGTLATSTILVGIAKIISGTGVPEGSITASVPTMFFREDGSGTYTLYLKKTGTGNTGWVPVA